MIGPERRDAERADLAFRHRDAGLGIDHLDEEHVGPDVDAVMHVVLGAHQAGFAHAEHVVDLGAPHAADLLALGLRQRLGRAHHLLHGRGGEIDALGLGEIGEMQREARHADEDGRLQRLDQPELRLGRHRIAGADPVHADIEPMRGARPDLAGRVNADRERHMHQVALADSDAGKRAAPGQQPVGDVVGGARIEHRLAGRAAGAPEFRDLGMRHRAELLHEAGVIEACAGCPCRGSEWSATPPDRRAGSDRYGRACRDTRAACGRDRRRSRLRSLWIVAISARDFGNGNGSGADMGFLDRPVVTVSAGSRPDAIPLLQILARNCRDWSRRGLRSMTGMPFP